MLVDDSVVIRSIFTRLLSESPDIKIIASAGNGQAALDALDRYEPDVILLDIEMPVMDGLTALPLLLKKRPEAKVIMVSTLSMKNAEISLRAMQSGASDYIPKPTSTAGISADPCFIEDLAGKIRALGDSVRRRRQRLADTRPEPRPFSAQKFLAPKTGPETPDPAKLINRNRMAPASVSPAFASAPVTLRKPSLDRPDILAIGSSTGGPQALFRLFEDLKKGGGIRQPVVITQHMPPMFTTLLSEQIARITGLPTREGAEGDTLEPGHIYVAPGGFHMLLENRGRQVQIRISDAPPENFCRPAVDPMFRSVAKIYGSRALAVVLTGMGSDGAKGSVTIADAGGTVIAQDEGTSVVWGMPGATAHSGACSAVLPLDDIGPYILRTAKR
ncbi:chemotaxis response regulator protein-glutamate methylesterase [Phaeovibrio sulfidiphilus]|uniref:Protein-glutamate methylesterase/protein-glutamine glutaminase n=2 Tax=Phaeovibrio sulfidiphilus TaxID=1220600 RepID=A0A8J7CC01_9PROT|nr:chemotaxis response regulator protein-glutamate methylesterase [Phaeovibrio sulfidiphilus]